MHNGTNHNRRFGALFDGGVGPNPTLSAILLRSRVIARELRRDGSLTRSTFPAVFDARVQDQWDFDQAFELASRSSWRGLPRDCANADLTFDVDDHQPGPGPQVPSRGLTVAA